jgi:hypothetical protein
MTNQFKAIDRFGAEINFQIIEPTMLIDSEGEIQYRVAFSHAIQMGILTRDKMREILKDKGILTAEDDNKFQTALREVGNLEVQLGKAQLESEESNCAAIATKLFEARNRMFELFMVVNNAFMNSAEGYAELIKQEAVMAACTRIGGTNQRYWKNYKEYVKERDGETRSTVVEELQKAYDIVMSDKSKKLVEDCPESKYLKTVAERILDRAVEQGKEADAIVKSRVEEVVSDEPGDVSTETGGGTAESDKGSPSERVEEDAAKTRKMDEQPVS